MRKLLFVFALALPCFGVTLIKLQTTSAATTALVNFPLGSYQIAGRFSGLPSTMPGSDVPLFVIPTDVSGHKITCTAPTGTANSTVNISCYNTTDNASSGGLVTLPLPTGTTAIRFVMTQQKDATYGQVRVDVWGDDCSEIGNPTISKHLWGVEPSLDLGEPSTTSQTFSLGGNSLGVDFFRASGYPSGGISADPVCPADVLATPAPNMDFRFEGNSTTDVSGNGYVLSIGTGGFAPSTTYNPVVFITGNWTAPRPVIAQVPVNLVCNPITSDGNAAAATYTWSNQSASDTPYTPVTGSFSATNTATTTFTPTNSGSFWPRCAVMDASGNAGQQDLNIGVVASDANGIKIQSNSELGIIIGPIPRFCTESWTWYCYTDAASADMLAPYYAPPPMPATSLGSVSGGNYMYFSARGPYTGLVTDVIQVKFPTTTTYQWQKNGGGYSASLPVFFGFNGQTGCVGTPLTMPVTDGVIICLGGTPTLNDVFTLMVPQAGTATVSSTGSNHVDSSTGYICGGATAPCSGNITVTGTGTHWQTGTASQALTVGQYYWFEWDWLSDGSNQGRFYTQVNAVNSDTSVTVGGNAGSWPIPAAKSSGMTIQAAGSDCTIYFTCTGQPQTSLNYYDAGLGVLRLAEATNLDVYTNEAKQWCNIWWQYGLDHGYNSVVPRNAGWHTLTACASKFGFTSWWGVEPASSVPGTGLAYNITYPQFQTYNPTSPIARGSNLDIREAAYQSQAVGAFTQTFPAHTASPVTTQMNWCTYSANLITNLWLNPWLINGGIFTEISGAYDYWQDALVNNGSNISFPGIGTPAGNYATSLVGTSPWRDMGLGTIANTSLYNALVSAGCGSVLAPSVMTLVKRAADFIYFYGRSPDDGLYYNAQYQSDAQPGFTTQNVLHNFQSKYGDVGGNEILTVTGGVNVVAASPNLAVAFLRRFGPCNGTTSITLGASNYQVDACADDYHLTLHTSAPNGNYGYTSWGNPATIAVTNGSANVVGTGTGFQAFFAPYDGTTFNGILGATGTDNGVYQITGCVDQTHCTISPVWSGTNQSAQQDFTLSKKASTSCAPSIGSCEPDAFNGKNLAHDWVVSLGQKYQWTGDPTDRNHLEKGLASLYGGSALGPAFIGPNAGPQASPTLPPANYDGVLPICATTAFTVQPCTQSSNGSGFAFNLLVKPYAESSGAGNSDNAHAFYLTPATSIGSRTPGNIRVFGGAR